jgi:polysaccharide export outer membrane protein
MLPVSIIFASLASTPVAEKTASEPGKYAIAAPDILRIEVTGLRKKAQAINGEYFVRPDGTVSLGTYGSISVDGKTTAEVQASVEELLQPYTKKKRIKPTITVDVAEWNSKSVYLIVDHDNAAQTVIRYPAKDLAVADVILTSDGVSALATTGKVWLTSPNGVIRSIDWKGITQEGVLKTNYILNPGDRLIIDAPKVK